MPAAMTTAEIEAGLAILSALCHDPASEVQTPVNGFSYAEIADIIGCSEAAIRKCAANALLKLRHRLPADITTQEISS